MITREKVLAKYIKNKDVLDIGSVGQTTAYNLWNFLEKHTGNLTGIDTEYSDDNRIVRGNIENYNFGKQFDVIVAGDVLEHVDNQGLFLDNVKKHPKKDGYFILTTPNAKWFTVTLKPNPTHTLWHDKYTLFNILNRYNFEIVFFKYYAGNKKHNPLKKIIVFRQGIIAVCKHKSI